MLKGRIGHLLRNEDYRPEFFLGKLPNPSSELKVLIQVWPCYNNSIEMLPVPMAVNSVDLPNRDEKMTSYSTGTN